MTLLVSNGEEPPVKRRRMTFDILMLPDELVWNCLARVSRLHYPTLSLVSKRFRSFLTSTELYQTRTLLSRTESCLYVCLRLRSDPSPLRWFTLCRRPNSPRKVLVPTSSLHYPLPEYLPAAALVGSNLYVIGGSRNNTPYSSVMVVDCRSHTWREAPSMRATRVSPAACVLDGKIYVVGGNTLGATMWMEVFDTKTETWESVPAPGEEICRYEAMYRRIAYDGKVCVATTKRDTCELHKGRWRRGPLAMNRFCCLSSHCVIDNVLYRCSNYEIRWYD